MVRARFLGKLGMTFFFVRVFVRDYLTQKKHRAKHGAFLSYENKLSYRQRMLNCWLSR